MFESNAQYCQNCTLSKDDYYDHMLKNPHPLKRKIYDPLILLKAVCLRIPTTRLHLVAPPQKST